MPGSLLEVSNLSWQAGNKSILDDISFRVKPGQFVGIIGGNGSGKTSLLRTLYRYTKPCSGQVLLNQRDIWQQTATAIAQQIAVVTQAPSALPYVVSEVVAMGLTPHKGLFEQTNKRDEILIKAALAQVNLVEMAGNNFDTLSGGEQQRVLIARAIVQQGQLLIMDEPTNHLDVHYQIDILNRVKHLGTTVIASLHDLNIASAFCDHLILLDHGKIVCQGTPKEVLTQEIISDIYRVNVTIGEHPSHHNPHLLFHYQATPCQK